MTPSYCRRRDSLAGLSHKAMLVVLTRERLALLDVMLGLSRDRCHRDCIEMHAAAFVRLEDERAGLARRIAAAERAG